MAPRALLLFALVPAALAACAAAPGPAPNAAASPAVERVVVAPLNLTVRAPAELAGKGGPVWSELLRYFQERDREVSTLSPLSAERLWLEATRGLDLSDRRAALSNACARFARDLAGHRDFDVLVLPSLVVRPAHVSGQYASWDGVQRPVPMAATTAFQGLGDLVGPGVVSAGGLTGKVAAVSLHVVVLQPDGTRLYAGLGGLDVLQEARRDRPAGELSFALREQPLAAREWIAEGVQRAFEGPPLTARGR